MRFFLVPLIFLCSAMAADLDPAILNFKVPEDLKWSGTSKTFQQAVLYGDPTKPGLSSFGRSGLRAPAAVRTIIRTTAT